jgi:regulation of enolase protein 1 (concanavalin A-like superfamily)
MSSFSLTAPPNTDLWRKPPSRDTSTAPILYTSLLHPFIAAEVLISADWELEWDQAGLVIFAGAPTGRRPPEIAGPDGQPPSYVPAPASKWVKAGLEFCGGRCNASSVCATSDGADWSLSPLSSSCSSSSSIQPARLDLLDSRVDLRVKLERVGYALWIWFEDPSLEASSSRDGETGWKKLREVTWFFWGVEDKAVRVGVYACRPANFGGFVWDARHATSSQGEVGSDVEGAEGGGGIGHRGLSVDFEGLEIF